MKGVYLSVYVSVVVSAFFFFFFVPIETFIQYSLWWRAYVSNLKEFVRAMSQKCSKKIKYENWELLFCSVIWLVKRMKTKTKQDKNNWETIEKHEITKQNETKREVCNVWQQYSSKTKHLRGQYTRQWDRSNKPRLARSLDEINKGKKIKNLKHCH